MTQNNIIQNNNNLLNDNDITLTPQDVKNLKQDLVYLLTEKRFENSSSGEVSSFSEAFPQLQKVVENVPMDKTKEQLKNTSENISVSSDVEYNNTVSEAIKENNLLDIFKNKTDTEKLTLLEKLRDDRIQNIFTFQDNKFTVDLEQAWKQKNKLYDFWCENKNNFEIATGLNPVALVSTSIVFNSVVKNFAKVAYPASTMKNMSAADLANRRKVILTFTLGAAPAITGLLIAFSNLKPVTSITTNVLGDSNINSSLMGVGILRRFFTNPGLWFFLGLTTISYIYKNYFSINHININIINIYQFSVLWVLIFLSYNLIILYITNSMTPSQDLKLPAYLPKFISSHLQLINVLVSENKQRAVETQIRVVFMYVLLLILIIVLFSLLIYFK